ncbi:winged helix-turn-helix domain-containing protein [Saccharopolyspora sp. TS4A08]|uniref:Winged helix-turn-helix domain-containing protein n=1 Tax=Saccharopolyspora ipomoeae TaxID=3042027 RepID=A0ABT6PJ73_9PSEU|nr:winged helix-turn-helix domain-containing protein [Saccharopolyspora sp. TS4A08]MDI2028033.1 winged helix-turn-helix domain-containing protein [Saccharopolyspora sp. TS4A08]
MTLEPTAADFAPEDAELVEVNARFVITREDLGLLERILTRNAEARGSIPVQSIVDTAPAAPPQLRILVAARQIVRPDGTLVRFTRLEFDLLLFLARNPGRVHHRNTLLAAVWDFASEPRTRTVDVHVRRIRTKLGPDLDLITTVRGVGYRLDHAERVRIVTD